MAKVKILFDQPYKDRYVRAWKEGREIIVQVWNSGEFLGDPDGDWAMPAVLGIMAAIEQAVLQTPKS